MPDALLYQSSPDGMSKIPVKQGDNIAIPANDVTMQQRGTRELMEALDRDAGGQNASPPKDTGSGDRTITSGTTVRGDNLPTRPDEHARDAGGPNPGRWTRRSRGYGVSGSY